MVTAHTAGRYEMQGRKSIGGIHREQLLHAEYVWKLNNISLTDAWSIPANSHV